MRATPSLGITGSTSIPPFPFGVPDVPMLSVLPVPLEFAPVLLSGPSPGSGILGGVWGVGNKEAAETLAAGASGEDSPVGVLAAANPFFTCGLVNGSSAQDAPVPVFLLAETLAFGTEWPAPSSPRAVVRVFLQSQTTCSLHPSCV